MSKVKFQKSNAQTKAWKATTSYKFNLFYKDFINAYGLATDDINKEVMCRRLKPFTCEYMRRPGIAVSEFSDTFEQNSSRLQNYFQSKNNLFKKHNINSLVEAFNHIAMVSSNLNAKKGIEVSTLKNDIIALYQIAYGKDPKIGQAQDSLIQQATHLGASLYLLGIHYQVFKFCALNVKWVKKHSDANSFNASYNAWTKKKRGNDLQGYMDVIEKDLRQGSSSRNKDDPMMSTKVRSFFLEEESDEEETDDDAVNERDVDSALCQGKTSSTTDPLAALTANQPSTIDTSPEASGKEKKKRKRKNIMIE